MTTAWMHLGSFWFWILGSRGFCFLKVTGSYLFLICLLLLFHTNLFCVCMCMCGGTHIPCIEEEMWDNSQELLSGSKFLYLLSPLTSICDLFIYGQCSMCLRWAFFSLCSWDWPLTPDLSSFTSQVLGLQVCTTMPRWSYSFCSQLSLAGVTLLWIGHHCYSPCQPKEQPSPVT